MKVQDDGVPGGVIKNNLQKALALAAENFASSAGMGAFARNEIDGSKSWLLEGHKSIQSLVKYVPSSQVFHRTSG